MDDDIVEVPTIGNDGNSYTIEIVRTYEYGPAVPKPQKRKEGYGEPSYRVKGSNIPVQPFPGGYTGIIGGVEIIFSRDVIVPVVFESS